MFVIYPIHNVKQYSTDFSAIQNDFERLILINQSKEPQPVFSLAAFVLTYVPDNNFSRICVSACLFRL